MKLDKHKRSEWKNSRVLAWVNRDGRPPFQYEGVVIQTIPKSPRVLVRPVNANQFSIPKWIEAEFLECLEVGE